ncbi:hypothetical protein CR513_10341, partial [Mucuna pruriens]
MGKLTLPQPIPKLFNHYFLLININIYLTIVKLQRLYVGNLATLVCFFFTITCNPNWPKIHMYGKEKMLQAYDRPYILCRLFYIKLQKLMSDFMDEKFFGNLYQLILYMVHMVLIEETHHVRNGKCLKFFVEKFMNSTSLDSNGFAIHRRRKNKISIVCKGVELDNRYIILYNRLLLMKYQTHINI